MAVEQTTQNAPARIIHKTDVVVIGAGQAGLAAAYWLQRLGLPAGTGFVVLDANPGPGGAWQHRWPTLTLSTVNGVHDLPGLAFADIVDPGQTEAKAAEAVPQYFGTYEEKFDLPVLRPVRVKVVCPRGERFRVETDGPSFSARGIVNATGTWENPNIPDIPGADSFRGQTLHSRDYRGPEEFAGKRVAIIGAGISAVQHLTEISKVAETLWITRRPPVFRDSDFTPDAGRAAVAMVEDRVRQGLVPGSVVSVTGIPWTPALREVEARGVLNPRSMFDRITETGLLWADGTHEAVDVILWATGFRSALDHLAPLNLREQNGGIIMAGRLATQVAKEPRVHLAGYGPSASTVGANRAGRAVASELLATLGIMQSPAADRSPAAQG
ncbi:flavin-containing monooxygenase [Paracoccus sulfuroxidans]|uniref:Cation diffusion facilitator CzcD-associated flavoprotein CzcO n=1 Tax=Paracoccus sulfuroxidans TaxID=384678 RepID=A0A562P1P8_9RHOB|nr:NAD(P)/FAD-dependent oxidoreductase [Paracoccus sulfuroxidans]TWI38253.1 cation diffusion facilitator CzcD-associated flavoprotein CzcO [Paracoccus sulfuroxidans]